MTKETLLIILPIGVSFAFIFGTFVCETIARSKAEKLLKGVAEGIKKQLSENEDSIHFAHKDRSQFTPQEKKQAARLLRRWTNTSVEKEGRQFLRKEICAIATLCFLALVSCSWLSREEPVILVLAVLMFSMIAAGAMIRGRQCRLRVRRAFHEVTKLWWPLLEELLLYQTKIEAGKDRDPEVETDMPLEDLEYTLNEEYKQRLKEMVEYIATGEEIFFDEDSRW